MSASRGSADRERLLLLWGLAQTDVAEPADLSEMMLPGEGSSDQLLADRLRRKFGVSVSQIVEAKQTALQTRIRCGVCRRGTPLGDWVDEDPLHCKRCGAPLELPGSLLDILDGPAPPEPASSGGIETIVERFDPTETAAEANDSPLYVHHYRIEENVGSGGMGTVFRAVHEGLGRPAAVKVLHPSLAADGRFLERFRREAQVLARIDHPNIVRVFDIGKDPHLGHYIVMEWVEGHDVKRHVEMHGPMKLADAIEAARQAAEGLACAHEAGVVHRDVKPSNLMLTDRGGRMQVKVADFGLARISAMGSSDVSITGQVVGTPAYMAPEQCRGRPVDARADLYSLGATLFHMIVGEPPFTSESPAEVFHQLLRAEPTIPPGLPDDVDALLRALLLKDPDARPPSAADLAARLRACL